MKGEMENELIDPPLTAVAARFKRVLLVDDDPIQTKLSQLRLAVAGFVVETASGADEALLKAEDGSLDAIVSDVVMRNLDGFEFCRRIRAKPHLDSVPVILVSAYYGGGADRELALQVGAFALVARTPNLETEIEALRRCLLEGRVQPVLDSGSAGYRRQAFAANNQLVAVADQARSAEQRYRALFEHATDMITFLTPDGVIVEANKRCEELLGIPRDQLVGRGLHDFAVPGQAWGQAGDVRDAVRKGSDRRTVLTRAADGTIRQIEFSTDLVDLDGQQVVLSIGRDLTEKVRTTDALAVAEDKYRSLVERLPEIIWTSNSVGQITFITPNVTAMLGIDQNEVYASGERLWNAHVHPDDKLRLKEAFAGFPKGPGLFDIEFRFSRPDRSWIWLRARAIAVYERDGEPCLEGMISDVTEKRRLEESLRMAQRMDAVGQLTGGIAHDFNNILAAIIANSHFLLEDLQEGDPRRDDANQIRLAAERAASLTRQLLAFSRKQILEPTILDLNAAVGNLESMLRRLIGEDIDLSILQGAELGSVRADLGQVEQVVMNLVVNARDAMPRGGKLSIETANVDLDQEYGETHMSAVSGRFVMLAVSDSGSGMDSETKRRLFEPFFTTKEKGKGTGLGLSTCYGIVKQSNGYIWSYSEPGRGSVFKVYLPRVDGRPTIQPAQKRSGNLHGTETVLLIEDDDRVRTVVQRILSAYGYRALVAVDGPEAVALAEVHGESIDLVLSDVVVPGMSGPEVVGIIQKHCPRVRSLFMSGYTDHAILRDGALEAGVNFIQKPFAPQILATKVRQVLDS